LPIESWEGRRREVTGSILATGILKELDILSNYADCYFGSLGAFEGRHVPVLNLEGRQKVS
jgi:hypothetical protein